MRGHGKNKYTHKQAHMHTQTGMQRHLTPRHKPHCFALNIVPIIGSCRDSEGRCCYGESSRGRATRWPNRGTALDTSAWRLTVGVFSQGKYQNRSCQPFSWQPRYLFHLLTSTLRNLLKGFLFQGGFIALVSQSLHARQQANMCVAGSKDNKMSP